MDAAPPRTQFFPAGRRHDAATRPHFSISLVLATTYFYLNDIGLLVTAYWGRTEIRKSQVVRDARASDPAARHARAHVIDLSGMEGSTSDAIAETSKFHSLGAVYVEKHGLIPTAVIASSPHIYGEARIFQTLAGLATDDLQVKVVSSWADAAEFLLMDLGAAEAEVRRRRQTD